MGWGFAGSVCFSRDTTRQMQLYVVFGHVKFTRIIVQLTKTLKFSIVYNGGTQITDV